MAGLQAAAAAGQTALMLLYEQAFRASEVAVAQVLLTHADLADRVRGNNARAALRALLEAGAVPNITYNDSVSVEEIKFGDNDHLAALVAPLVDADLLLLLSDVDGLLGAGGVRVATVHDIEREALPHVRAGVSAARGVGTGGMASKLEAARVGTLSGAHTSSSRMPGGTRWWSRSCAAKIRGRCSSRLHTGSLRRSAGSPSLSGRAGLSSWTLERCRRSSRAARASSRSASSASGVTFARATPCASSRRTVPSSVAASCG